MKVRVTKEVIYKILLTVAVFWIADFLLHISGAGETTYYYVIKFANAVLFAFIWFAVFDSKKHWKKILFALIFGTWVSFYYLATSYSGLIQLLGVNALYAPPAFVVFGKVFSPYYWWAYHCLVFYIGLEIAGLVKRKR